jgi:predicted amidohydrolase
MSTLTITTIQTNLHWEDKAANLKMLEEKIMGIKEKTEIVVLPEMFNTGFTMQPEKLAETMEGETVAWMKRVAMEKRVVLVGSVAVKTEERTETGLSERTERIRADGDRIKRADGDRQLVYQPPHLDAPQRAVRLLR